MYRDLCVKTKKKRKTPQGTRRLWWRLFCIYFCVCGSQKHEDPQIEHHGWRRHYPGWYRRSGISGIYINTRHSYSIRHLTGTVIMQQLDSGVVTVDNSGTAVTTQLINCVITVTTVLPAINSVVTSLCLVGDWWNRSFSVYNLQHLLPLA